MALMTTATMDTLMSTATMTDRGSLKCQVDLEAASDVQATGAMSGPLDMAVIQSSSRPGV